MNLNGIFCRLTALQRAQLRIMQHSESSNYQNNNIILSQAER